MPDPRYAAHVCGIFRDVPELLKKIDAKVAPAELQHALAVRKHFELGEWQDPYMVDICRAFRLVDGARAYIEVGTRDKGNLAWVAPKLAPGAKMIDVDIDRFDESERRLRQKIGNVEYHCITGDSVGSDTLRQVRSALGDTKADAIFCDSSHMYSHALREFELYFPLLRPGGVLMYHDCFWEGNETHKGKMQAMMALDRFIPVYCVCMDVPIHRYVPLPEKTDVYGGVSIIVKP